MKYLQSITLSLFLASCASTRPPLDLDVRIGPVDPASEVIGESVEGREILCERFGETGPCVMFIATIHGNEAAGTPLLGELSRLLRDDPERYAGKQVVLVPVANPDGFEASRRYNVNDVDLNRNFPASNRRERSTSGTAPLSEPESRALWRLIRRYQPRLVISMHQPVACIDYDGPADEVARRMSEACGLPVKKLGARPGSLGSWVGVEREVPIITFELPGSASGMTGSALWEGYGEALLVALESDD